MIENNSLTELSQKIAQRRVKSDPQMHRLPVSLEGKNEKALSLGALYEESLSSTCDVA